MPPSSLDAHRALIEAYLAKLPFADELGALTDAMRYSLDGGGKRIRPVLCLATGEAVGADPTDLLPAAAAIGMIGGQFDDVRGGDDDLARRNSLKTGRLFEAAIGSALAVAEVPETEQAAWRRFGSEFGLLYQVVDDVLDGDGLAAELGGEQAHGLAGELEDRAREALAEISADTTLLDELLDGLRQRIA